MDLVRTSESLADLKILRAQMEECQLPERIRMVVADVNEAAGYHVLELLDFLPPQKTILRISFSKSRTEHVMEMVLRESGAALKFYSRRKDHSGWARYFPNPARAGNRAVFLELEVAATQILEEDIENWFTYLLSGFDRKFKPNSKQPSSEGSELRVSPHFRKASA